MNGIRRDFEAPTGMRELYDSIADITPRNEEQRLSKSSAVSYALELAKEIRYLGKEQTSSTSRALLVVELSVDHDHLHELRTYRTA